MIHVCPNCGYQFNPGKRAQRSIDISTRFHAHVHFVWRTLRQRGVQIGRDEVYIRSLIEACAIETVDGASPYPYVIIDGVLHPKRTTNRTNREMMQACEGVRHYALSVEIYELPEKKPVDGLSS